MGLSDSRNSKESQKAYNKTNQDNLDFQSNCNNKYSLIKCTYDIKDLNETQIINNRYEDIINEDIESKIKILNMNKKENLIFRKRFDKLGINVVYFIIEEKLNDMSNIFNNCSSLKKIEFISVFTEEVTNMESMFEGCTELEYIDLSNFNTINVKNMRAMFNKCHKLKQIIGINKLITTNVTDMKGMFQLCTELEYIDLSNFNTINVKNMGFMFNKCHKLKQIIGINKLITTNVTNMYGMFNECNELKSLDLSNFNTINVLDFGLMFQECFELTYVNISNFNFQNAKDIRWMFNKCYKLSEIKGINIINNIQNIEKTGIFDDCPKLKNIPNYEHKNIMNIIKKQINIKFISVDQEINGYAVTCYNTDIFENVLEKIYLKYPQFKNKTIFCLCGGAVVNERVSLAENKIEENSIILIDYS